MWILLFTVFSASLQGFGHSHEERVIIDIEEKIEVKEKELKLIEQELCDLRAQFYTKKIEVIEERVRNQQRFLSSLSPDEYNAYIETNKDNLSQFLIKERHELIEMIEDQDVLDSRAQSILDEILAMISQLSEDANKLK